MNNLGRPAFYRLEVRPRPGSDFIQFYIAFPNCSEAVHFKESIWDKFPQAMVDFELILDRPETVQLFNKLYSSYCDSIFEDLAKP